MGGRAGWCHVGNVGCHLLSVCTQIGTRGIAFKLHTWHIVLVPPFAAMWRLCGERSCVQACVREGVPPARRVQPEKLATQQFTQRF